MQKLFTYAGMFCLAGAVACGLYLGAASLTEEASESDETPQIGKRLVSFEALPAAVQDGLVKAASNGVIRRIEQRIANGAAIYEADVENNGKLFEITLAATGSVIAIRGEDDDSQKDHAIIFEQLPDPVREKLLQAAGNGTIRGIVRTVREGQVVYVAEIMNNDRLTTIAMDAAGTVLERLDRKGGGGY